MLAEGHSESSHSQMFSDKDSSDSEDKDAHFANDMFNWDQIEDNVTPSIPPKMATKINTWFHQHQNGNDIKAIAVSFL